MANCAHPTPSVIQLVLGVHHFLVYLKNIVCSHDCVTGVPFLAKLHFSSALSVNAEYAGLQSVVPAAEEAAQQHARLVVQASQSVITRTTACLHAVIFLVIRMCLISNESNCGIIWLSACD